jgi:hypothetical protein
MLMLLERQPLSSLAIQLIPRDQRFDVVVSHKIDLSETGIEKMT